MVQIGFRTSDELAAAFDAYAAARGGRTKVLRELITTALRDADIRVTPQRPLPTVEDGNSVGLLVRFTREDYARLDVVAGELGMTRAQWVRALVRKRLHARPQPPPWDRTRLKHLDAASRDLAGRIRRTLAWVETFGTPRSDIHDKLAGIERSLLQIAEGIRSAFQGDDDYWRAEVRSADRRGKR